MHFKLGSDSSYDLLYSMNLDYDSRVINGISIYATDNYLRDGIVRVNKDTEVEQTFKANRSFNYVRGYILHMMRKNNFESIKVENK